MSSDTAAEPTVIPATHFFNEAPFSTDLRNPRGDLLHIRAGTIEDFTSQLNAVWDGQMGERDDSTNVFLFSFAPAVQASMAKGETAEEAMRYEPDDMGKDTYDGIAMAARRQAAAPASGGGARSSGGGDGKPEKFKVADVGEGNLPSWFIDAITRRDTCPECDSDKFWDNRNSKRPGKSDPDFRCGNQDCDAGKGYPWAVWEPKEDDRPRQRGSSRTR